MKTRAPPGGGGWGGGTIGMSRFNQPFGFRANFKLCKARIIGFNEIRGKGLFRIRTFRGSYKFVHRKNFFFYIQGTP